MTDIMGKMIFEVKFGTPKPVPFREYQEYGNQVMDIDLEARFAGNCEVSEYDGERYANDEEVSIFIKSNCSGILKNCLEHWPEGASVMRSRFKGLDGRFSTELENRGISAKTEIVMINLTEDSEKIYKEHLEMITSTHPENGWDHMNPDTVVSKPEGTYMVTSSSLLFLNFKGGRMFYKPGERVDADYCAVASDTSYHVKVNAPELNVDYGSVIHISFTMPEHDVYISIASQPVMTSMPGNRGAFLGNMGDYSGTLNPVPKNKPIVSTRSEWTCPLCGTDNAGNFCSECGGARPSASSN